MLEATRDAGLEPLVDPAPFVAQSMVLPSRDPGTQIRVDLVFSFTPYEQEAIARSRVHVAGGAEVRFASPEDLIVHKMLAGRPRDLEDVRSILVRQPALDRDLVRRTLLDFDAALERDLSSPFDALAASI